MNVKHLLDDELEHELAIREVEYASGESRDAKRRKLRNVLRDQRETGNFETRRVPESDREVEFQMIDEKLAKIRDALENRKVRKSTLPELKTRLLHIYFRVLRLKEVFDIENLESITIMLLNDHFHMLSSDPDAALETSQRVMEDINQLRETDTDRPETDLASEQETDDDDEARTGLRKNSSTPCSVRKRSTEAQTKDTAEMLETIINYIDKRFEEMKISSSSRGSESRKKRERIDKIRFEDRWRNPGKEPRKTNYREIPSREVTDEELSERSSGSEIRTQKNLRRRPRAVSEWKLKYDGRDEGRNLNRFITEVEFMAEAEGIGTDMLYNEAIHLFEKDARSWYIEGKKNHEFRDWDELVTELKMEYQSPDMDLLYEPSHTLPSVQPPLLLSLL